MDESRYGTALARPALRRPLRISSRRPGPVGHAPSITL